MGGVHRSSYENIFFPKTGAAIQEQCRLKIENLKQRVKTREETIQTLLKEQKLETLDVMSLMERKGNENVFSNTRSLQSDSSASLLQTNALKMKDWEAIDGENKRRQEELDEITKLQRIVNHIGLDVTYNLSFSDLVYYEFT